MIVVARPPAQRRVERKQRSLMVGILAALAGPSVVHLAAPVPRPVDCPTLTLFAGGISLRITLRYPTACRPYVD
jgi:hypothetical protein